MRTFNTVLLVAIALIGSGQSFAAQIESDVAKEITPPSLVTLQGDGLTLSEAVEQVRRQCKCRIVRAETQCRSKRETHVIKGLTQDGKVRTFSVPGKRCG